MTINANKGQSIPFAEAANGNPELADIKSKIAAGDLSVIAPCNGMHDEWSSEEINSFKVALADMFGFAR